MGLNQAMTLKGYFSYAGARVIEIQDDVKYCAVNLIVW